MRKGISVYSHHANPGVDPPVFHITRTEADIRIDKGYAVWLTPLSIQTRPPGRSADEEKLVAGGVEPGLEAKVERLLPRDADGADGQLGVLLVRKKAAQKDGLVTS